MQTRCNDHLSRWFDDGFGPGTPPGSVSGRRRESPSVTPSTNEKTMDVEKDIMRTEESDQILLCTASGWVLFNGEEPVTDEYYNNSPTV